MSKQDSAQADGPPRPTTHYPDVWVAYRKAWYKYCDYWCASWKRQHLVGSQMRVADRVVERNVWLDYWKTRDRPGKAVPEIDGWHDYDAAWQDHWRTLGQPWRIKPEIDNDRQKELAKRRAIAPDINQWC